MKKLYSFAFCALALFALGTACSKEENSITEENGSKHASEKITISATLSDLPTKVAYAETDGAGLTLTWQEGDKLLVVNHANPTVDPQEFDLIAEYVGKQTGHFTGTLPAGASSYDISVVHATTDYSVQTQPKDGDLSALELIAYAEDVENISEFVLTDHSSILKIEAKLPEGVAGTITSVQIKAIDNTDATGATPSNIFFGGNTLTINLGEKADVDNDNILKLYATIPDKDSDPSNTAFIIKFISDSEHSEYTRFVVLKDGATLAPMAVHTLKINCSNIDKHAGLKTDDGSEAHPYLIADKYQLAAVNKLLESETKYFKLIADIDMTGVEDWDGINKNSPYLPYVFDGNNKTVSNLAGPLFYLIKGTVKDLTLDNFNATGYRGVLAEYIQGTDNLVSNITITNGTVDSGKDNTGGLIGTINSSGTTATITNCTVSDTDVTGTGVTGGLIGFADAKVTVSGCTYTDGTVKSTSNRYCGGLFGSTGNNASVITDCHVKNATIEAASDRVGGFIGQLQSNVQIKGCTVGTSSQRVIVKSKATGKTVNVGGFVGVCYGTVTKNGDVRSQAFVTITSSNETAATSVNIGGFAGYLDRCTIEYSDADADMSSLIGQQVGGFGAWLTGNNTKIDNCTSNSNVKGNNYTGGFIGNTSAHNHIVTNNTASGTVTGAATVGGFAGMISQGTWAGNSASCTVSGTTNIGGFAGQINGNVTVSRSSYSGETTATGNVCGGFTAIASNGATINDCYTTGTLSGATRKRGGIAGHVDAGTVSINRCYSTINISNNFEMGGLVGVVGVDTFTMTKCAAWNGTLVAASRLSSNWSSAACIGVTSLACTLTDNYRSPNMDLLAYWGTNSGCTINLPNSFQHPDVSSTAPLTDPDGAAVTSNTMRPYQGKCDATKTLSELASTTLGWSSDVWNFEGPLPILK